MGGKPRAQPKIEDPKTGELVTEEQYQEAEAWVARMTEQGGKELTGYELRAYHAAEEYARKIEERLPFPRLGDEESAESFAARLDSWRKSSRDTEADLRKRRRQARATAKSIRALMETAGDDGSFVPSLKTSLQSSLDEALSYEMFLDFTLQLACRKGGNKGTNSDQATEAAIIVLYWRGLSKLKIAKVLSIDRSDVKKVIPAEDGVGE